MRLSYRGIHYNDRTSILEMCEGEIGGKYRGQDWRYRYPKHIPQLRPKLYRHYRGVAYGTHPIPSIENSSVTQPVLEGNSCSVPIRKPHKVIINKTEEIHLDNIRRSLERRLQVAQTKGDENLIELLEKEYQQLQ